MQSHTPSCTPQVIQKTSLNDPILTYNTEAKLSPALGESSLLHLCTGSACDVLSLGLNAKLQLLPCSGEAVQQMASTAHLQALLSREILTWAASPAKSWPGNAAVSHAQLCFWIPGKGKAAAEALVERTHLVNGSGRGAHPGQR